MWVCVHIGANSLTSRERCQNLLMWHRCVLCGILLWNMASATYWKATNAQSLHVLLGKWDETKRERESEKISLASQPYRMSEWYWYLLMTRQSYTASCSNMFSSFADKKTRKWKMCCTITISSNALISILQKLIWSTTEAAHLRLNWPGSLFWRQVCSR